MPWESACDLTGIGRRGVNWIGAPAHLCWPSHRRRHCTKFLTPKTSRCALLRHALNIAKEIICFPNSHVTFPQTQRQGDGKDNASQGGASRYAKTELLEKQFDVWVCMCVQLKKKTLHTKWVLPAGHKFSYALAYGVTDVCKVVICD